MILFWWLRAKIDQDDNNILLLLILLPGREADKSTATRRGSPLWRRTRPQGWWPASPSGGLAIIYILHYKLEHLVISKGGDQGGWTWIHLCGEQQIWKQSKFLFQSFSSLPLEWKQAVNLTLDFCVRSVRLFYVDVFPGLFPSHFISYILLLSFIFIFNKSSTSLQQAIECFFPYPPHGCQWPLGTRRNGQFDCNCSICTTIFDHQR